MLSETLAAFSLNNDITINTYKSTLSENFTVIKVAFNWASIIDFKLTFKCYLLDGNFFDVAQVDLESCCYIVLFIGR